MEKHTNKELKGQNIIKKPIYRYYQNIETRWINFENMSGEKGKGGEYNHGAKGHAWEHFEVDEEKILCDFKGSGVIRRIWLTLSDRSPEVLQNVYIKMFWDNARKPQVNVPLGDFFCMGLGVMRCFENHFFSTAEGRSFLCVIPMPFRRKAKIVLCNNSGKYINNLFYDINLTVEKLTNEDMYFFADFKEYKENELEKNVNILNIKNKQGRFLGTNIAVIPNSVYEDIWWGEGEVKIFLDGDRETPTLVGTGAEDYVGSAWELGEFINDCQGCVNRINNSVSMYRFHINDLIFFEKDIKIEIQALGGGPWERVKSISKKVKFIPVTYDDGNLHCIYKQDKVYDLTGYVNFFRQDHYRIVAYYYSKSLI